MFSSSARYGLALLLFVLNPALVQAATINLFANLDGTQEVPSNGRTGSGTAVITFDDVSKLLSWDINFSGLTGPAISMHFHGPAPAGTNAGVRVNVGNISGLTSPSMGSTTITDAAWETELLSGLWYLNIHTAMYGGGEIRGQVEVVPVPAAVWLMFSGLAGLALAARRR